MQTVIRFPSRIAVDVEKTCLAAGIVLAALLMAGFAWAFATYIVSLTNGPLFPILPFAA